MGGDGERFVICEMRSYRCEDFRREAVRSGVVVVCHSTEDRDCGDQVFLGRSNLYMDDCQAPNFLHLMSPTDEIVNETLIGGFHVSPRGKTGRMKVSWADTPRRTHDLSQSPLDSETKLRDR